jgi:hypothetical protein
LGGRQKWAGVVLPSDKMVAGPRIVRSGRHTSMATQHRLGRSCISRNISDNSLDLLVGPVKHNVDISSSKRPERFAAAHRPSMSPHFRKVSCSRCFQAST